MQYRKVNTNTKYEGHPDLRLATLPREVDTTTYRGVRYKTGERMSDSSELDQC